MASGGPWVFVANHASYLDGLVLAAALPPDAAYVVKSELRRRPLVHLVLRRLGCVFVERFDPSKGEEESTKAARALARGDHLVIFPEGTLRPIAGLQRFRMGAFVIAARTATPVVPVVIGGTRAKLRGGTWLPRPGDVTVTICPPEEPEGPRAGRAGRRRCELRDRTRRAMLERLAEPDLDLRWARTAGSAAQEPSGGALERVRGRLRVDRHALDRDRSRPARRRTG